MFQDIHPDFQSFDTSVEVVKAGVLPFVLFMIELIAIVKRLQMVVDLMFDFDVDPGLRLCDPLVYRFDQHLRLNIHSIDDLINNILFERFLAFLYFRQKLCPKGIITLLYRGKYLLQQLGIFHRTSSPLALILDFKYTINPDLSQRSEQRHLAVLRQPLQRAGFPQRLDDRFAGSRPRRDLVHREVGALLSGLGQGLGGGGPKAL